MESLQRLARLDSSPNPMPSPENWCFVILRSPTLWRRARLAIRTVCYSSWRDMPWDLSHENGTWIKSIVWLITTLSTTFSSLLVEAAFIALFETTSLALDLAGSSVLSSEARTQSTRNCQNNRRGQASLSRIRHFEKGLSVTGYKQRTPETAKERKHVAPSNNSFSVCTSLQK